MLAALMRADADEGNLLISVADLGKPTCVKLRFDVDDKIVALVLPKRS